MPVEDDGEIEELTEGLNSVGMIGLVGVGPLNCIGNESE